MYYILTAAIILITSLTLTYLFSEKRERRKNTILLCATTVASFSGLFLALELSKIETKLSEKEATAAILKAAFEEAVSQFADVRISIQAGEDGIADLKDRVTVLGLDIAAEPLYSELALRHIHPMTMQYLMTSLKYSQYRHTELIKAMINKNGFMEQLTKYEAELKFVRYLLGYELDRLNGKISDDDFTTKVLHAFDERRKIVFPKVWGQESSS